MKISNIKALVASAVLGSVLTNVVGADEPGVVRISDRVQQTAGQDSSSVPPPPPSTLPAEVTGEGLSGKNDLKPIPEGVVIDGRGIEGEVIYLDEHGNQIAGPYGHGRRGKKQFAPKTYKTRTGIWVSGDPHAMTLPVDYGFVPPTAWPYVQYDPVIYQRYLPNQLYGTPGMRYTDVQLPIVHTPTDTTQLGYNYMYVPQWQPNPAMYPQAPNPIRWERRVDWRDSTKMEQWNGMILYSGDPIDRNYRDGVIIQEETPVEGVIIEEEVIEEKVIDEKTKA